MTRVYASNIFDIVWLKLVLGGEDLYFCFFYAPSSHHPLPARKSFYDQFSREFKRFASQGKVFLVGDTNARLGSFLDDKNLNGKTISNPNKPLFMEFLQYSGLVVLNSQYSKGTPTYEIANKKRSIIDLCLTDSAGLVWDFVVDPTPLGVNSQTCHRALVITLAIGRPERIAITAPMRATYGRLSQGRQRRIVSEVSDRVVSLVDNGASPDYSKLVDLFATAKRRILGPRVRNRNAAPLSPALLNLQGRFNKAVAIMTAESSAFSFFVVDNLEKLLQAQYKYERKRRFSAWLKMMDDLDFRSCVRTFFSELRRKQFVKEEPGPIRKSYGVLSNCQKRR